MSFEQHNLTEEHKSLLGGVDTGEKETKDQRGSSKNVLGVSNFNVFAVLVCLLCTGINIYAFNAAGKPQVRRYYDLGKLRRPSQFVGLDRVKLPDQAPNPILIYPNLISIINRAEASRAYSDDPIRFAEIGGLVPPEDRQFKVTSEISTVIEFRAIDYKMENCELTITTPPVSATNVVLGLGSNVVNIWKTVSEFPLNAKTLSWNNRPTRVSKVATVSMIHGMNYTHRFHCPSDSLHTFELSANDDATYVDWSQDHQKPTPGVVMWQYASFHDTS